MKIASKALGITAWHARVSTGKDSQPYFRMFFHLEEFAADTNLAQHIAGAVLLTAELFYGPLIMRGEEELAFELPRHGYPSRRRIFSASQLAAAAISHGITPAARDFLAREISSCLFIADEVFGAAWALAPHPVRQSRLYDAMAFYSASVGEMSHRAPYKTHSISASGFRLVGVRLTLTIYALSFGSATD